jgi:hypothetical protein
MPRYFFGLYVSDDWCASRLDLIRYICDPQIDDRSHVTLRGPYKRNRLDGRKIWARSRFRYVVCDRIGAFSGPGQQTVYFRVLLPRSEDLMWKPDYPDGVAHLTLYDGDNRQFANAVRTVLDSIFDIGFKVRVGEIALLDDEPKPLSSDLLLQGVCEDLGIDLISFGSADLPMSRRLAAVELVGQSLKREFEKHDRVM